MKSDEVTQSWENFLNPELIRPRLAEVGLFIIGFEMLRDSIIGRIRDFLTLGFGPEADDSPEYAAVLKRNRSSLYASLDWLRERGAIDDQDFIAFERVKDCRNKLAHNPLSAVVEALPPDFYKCFAELTLLVRKIEVWWLTEVEIPTNPDFDGQDVDEDGIVPGSILGLQMLLQVALGSAEESKYLYEEFKQRIRQSVQCRH